MKNHTAAILDEAQRVKKPKATANRSDNEGANGAHTLRRRCRLSWTSMNTAKPGRNFSQSEPTEPNTKDQETTARTERKNRGDKLAEKVSALRVGISNHEPPRKRLSGCHKKPQTYRRETGRDPETDAAEAQPRPRSRFPQRNLPTYKAPKPLRPSVLAV